MSTEENNRDPEERTPGEPEESSPESTEEESAEGQSKAAREPSDGETSENEEDSGIEDEADLEEGLVEDSEEGRVAELEVALLQTVRERDEYYDAMLRTRAEFENSRKRMERERERILQTASERVLVALLPVLDNLERALDSDGDVREGVRATRDQLVGVLDGEGLLPVESDGEHFDPAVHEAVMSQPSDEHEEGVVIQTFERGYLLNGKTVRVAKVVVAQ